MLYMKSHGNRWRFSWLVLCALQVVIHGNAGVPFRPGGVAWGDDWCYALPLCLCNKWKYGAGFVPAPCFHGKSFFLTLVHDFQWSDFYEIELFCLPFSVIAVNEILNFGIAEITVVVGTASAAVRAAGIVTAGQCQKQSDEESDDTYFFHGDAFFLYYYRRWIPPAW